MGFPLKHIRMDKASSLLPHSLTVLLAKSPTGRLCAGIRSVSVCRTPLPLHSLGASVFAFPSFWRLTSFLAPVPAACAFLPLPRGRIRSFPSVVQPPSALLSVLTTFAVTWRDHPDDPEQSFHLTICNVMAGAKCLLPGKRPSTGPGNKTRDT